MIEAVIPVEGPDRLVSVLYSTETGNRLHIPACPHGRGNSRSYTALGHQGRAVAWAGKTYVVPTFDTFVELPGYAEHHGGGTPVAERVGAPCLKHFITMSVTGICKLCE